MKGEENLYFSNSVHSSYLLFYAQFPLVLVLIILTFSVQPFKCLVSVAARALFNLSARCWRVFFHSDEKDIHLMG
jgi:hypothetical protein